MKTREDLFLHINKLEVDDFGRPSGVLMIDKPADISSHDVVDKVRRILKIKQVGHGGALDVFATGLEIVLVGKATKLSDGLLTLDKSYEATILFGVSTTTQDIEGEIVNQSEGDIIIDKGKIEEVISKFKGEQDQFVSPFSSVKVNGQKLRKVLRNQTYTYKIEDLENGERMIMLKHNTDSQFNYNISIPKKRITIFDIKSQEIATINTKDVNIKNITPDKTYTYCKIYVKCSKGTYIRQLAEDIGKELNIPSVLIKLDRVTIGNWTKADTIKYSDLESVLLESK
jgi:tRNA pseudouridine55 synthase